MPGTTTWLTSPALLPLGAVELGRLVLSPVDPSQDYYAAVPALRPTADDILLQHLEKFSEVLVQSRGSRFSSFLSKLATSSFSARTGSTVSIESVLCKSYMLLNSGRYFTDVLCRTPDARQWLEAAVGRQKSVYLVTGVKTLMDASVSADFQAARKMGVDVSLPLTQLLPGAFPLDFLDVGAGVAGESKMRYRRSVEVPAEQIYAVQFRKVEFAWFSSRSLDKASLSDKNRWKVYLQTSRSSGYQDVIDAELAQVADEDDFEEESSETLTIVDHV
ncbi:hypothetical protein EDC01DRAFT_775024 [Geopyxis carbonaria]|nr:hypothetical protein EDC01DRAFT_775024 [Geopyxis carbonaria]